MSTKYTVPQLPSGVTLGQPSGTSVPAIYNALAVTNLNGVRAVNNVQEYPVIFAMGTTVVLDGGQAYYIYQPTDTTSTDNGNTILVDTGGNRWYKFSPVYSNVTFTGSVAFTTAPTSVTTTVAAGLPTLGQLQTGALNYAADTGAANALAAAIAPAVTALTVGMVVHINPAHANTGATTFALNGLTAYPVYGSINGPLQGGEIVAGQPITLQLGPTGTVWYLSSGSSARLVPVATKSQQAPQLQQVQALAVGGQTPVNYSSSGRALGTTYTNTLGRPMCLAVAVSGSGSSANMLVSINGSTAIPFGYSSGFVVIPLGATYNVTDGGGTLSAWWEW
ncbi:MAG: hypothetical protein P4N59_11480 [Negativicutes bacterium]|nr:hypothetical protein [Negativicutes bacterium]